MVLERIGCGGQAEVRKAHRVDRAGRGTPGMQRFGHGAEIGHQAAGHAPGQGQRMSALRGREPVQMGDGGGRAHRAQHRGRVPALEMIGIGLAREQFGPDLVADQVGADRVGAGCAQALALGQHGRHQHRARVSAERDVVVVERMGRGGVDQRGIGS